MDLPALTAFVKVVQTGSFTRAAAALGTQKAHLSRVVTQLERELGARLLERTTRSLSLTEVGREFYERSVGILAAVDDAQRAVVQAQGQPRGTLRLTCGVEFGLIAVSRWLAGYLALYPQVQADADFTGRVVDIVHEGFDLAVRIGPLADSSLAARKLGELAYGLFASPDYLARRGVPMHPRELPGHDLVAFSGGAARGTSWTLTWAAAPQLAPVQVPVQPRLRINNSFAVRDSACAALGIALLPWWVAGEPVSQGALQPVLGDWAPPTVPVHAVFASARYLTPKVRAFIDHAVADFDGGPLATGVG